MHANGEVGRDEQRAQAGAGQRLEGGDLLLPPCSTAHDGDAGGEQSRHVRGRGARRGELEGHIDAGESRRHQGCSPGILVAPDHGGDGMPARVERRLHRTAHPARTDHDRSHSGAPEEFAVKTLHDGGTIGFAHHEGEVGGRGAL